MEVLDRDAREGLEGLGNLLDELLGGKLVGLDLLVGTAPRAGPAETLGLLLVGVLGAGAVINEDQELRVGRQ
jgi:hypothetical protein